jgi:GMP synthase (glutamine-hydrolysing)
VQLARSALCERQAIRVGPCAWGLQFHIEMTPEMVDDWLDEASNEAELAGLDYIDPQAIRAATPTAYPQMQQLGQQVLSRFAERCRTTGT